MREMKEMYNNIIGCQFIVKLLGIFYLIFKKYLYILFFLYQKIKIYYTIGVLVRKILQIYYSLGAAIQ